MKSDTLRLEHEYPESLTLLRIILVPVIVILLIQVYTSRR